MTGIFSNPDLTEESVIAAVGPSVVAKVCGRTRQAVVQWYTKQGRVPAACVLQVEAMSGISRHRLRPDVFGQHAGLVVHECKQDG